jgi:hypothetical protein
MTLELRARVSKLAAAGYGHEDICVLLGIKDPAVRKLVRDLTLFHVKHVQPERQVRRAVS